MDWKQEIMKRLDILAEKLGTTATYLWHVLVRQGIVEGITDVFVAVIFLVGLIVGIKLIKFAMVEGPRSSYKVSDCSDRTEWRGQIIFSLVTGVALTGAGVIGFTCWLYWGIQYILNPEYFALQELLKQFK